MSASLIWIYRTPESETRWREIVANSGITRGGGRNGTATPTSVTLGLFLKLGFKCLLPDYVRRRGGLGERYQA